MKGKKLITDIITDRSIPLYAKLPCVDDPKWKNRELVCTIRLLNTRLAHASCSVTDVRKGTMKKVFRSNPLLVALELDSEWLPAFAGCATKVVLPELELISIWGIVLVLYLP